jgi:NTP pyrophosphatase (non-canonical NTP hydrolase)
MNKTQEKSRNVGMLMGRAERDTDCMTASASNRRPTAREQKQMEAKRAAYEADLARQRETEQLDRARRLFDSLGVLEGSFIAPLLSLGAIVNEQMNAQGFWESDNDGEKIALMHSELSEGLEAVRKDLESDHIPGFSGIEEELADTIIRIVDYAVQKDLRLGEAVFAKMRFNLTRPFKHDKAF